MQIKKFILFIAAAGVIGFMFFKVMHRGAERAAIDLHQPSDVALASAASPSPLPSPAVKVSPSASPKKSGVVTSKKI